MHSGVWERGSWAFLGEMYARGSGGVQRDEGEAFRCFQMSCAKKHPCGMHQVSTRVPRRASCGRD